jgi:uncharacterized protein (DUF2336 family)
VKAEANPGLDTSVFETVIQSGSVDARRQLARELAGLTANPESPDGERQAVIPSILKLATDPVVDVRRTLAEGLSVAEKIHHDIVFTIVADEDEIALPFISIAAGLDSSMMVAIAKVGDLARQMQIALRGDVSPDAVNFIAARCELPVCVALFDNPAAQLEDKHFRILYSRFSHAPQIVERLLACEHLPLDIRILQARRASNRIHQLMAERGWVPANDAAEIVADAEETAVLNILTAATPEELQRTIRFLTAKNMLTPSIIMRAACLGEMEIVERAFAHLCDMPVSRTAQLVYGRGPVSLRALYKKAGLPANCFWLIRAAIDVEREARDEGYPLGSGDFGRRLIEAVMTRYEGMSMTERAKQLEVVSRFAEEQVRVIAGRLKTDLLRAA